MASKLAVKVAFRVDKDLSHVLTAVFSGDADRHTGQLLSYEHNGQHSHCSREWYERETRPATPEQYADLLHELEGRGYAVTVVKRVNWRASA